MAPVVAYMYSTFAGFYEILSGHLIKETMPVPVTAEEAQQQYEEIIAKEAEEKESAEQDKVEQKVEEKEAQEEKQETEQETKEDGPESEQ